MGDFDGDGDGSSLLARPRFRLMCSVKCMLRIGLGLVLGSTCDVRAVVSLNFRVMVKRE